MRVFVTGATGFIGSAVVAELIEAGHQVTGLARSDEAARSLAAAGATAHRGSLEDLESLRSGAAAADGAIHLAFFHEFTHASITTRLRVLANGSPRGIVSRFTTAGRTATEDDAADPGSVGGPRAASEAAMLKLASDGVRASVVRLPPVVHGDGDRSGFLPRLIGAARKNHASGYLGDGRNRWPAVHRLDAAHLFRLALENGAAGARYHGVAEEGIPVLDIASALGERLNIPVTAIPASQAARQFSWIAPFLPVDNPASSALTRERLDWKPAQPGLLEDIRHGAYFPVPASAA